MRRRTVRRRAPAAPAAALAVALALAGCLVVGGCGSAPATRAQVIKRGNAICFATEQALRTAGAPAGGVSLSNLAASAAYFSKVAQLDGQQATQLRALPRPASGRATLDAFVSAASRAAADYARLAKAARSGDGSAADRALQDLDQVPVTRLAAAYGLTQCTGTAGTDT